MAPGYEFVLDAGGTLHAVAGGAGAGTAVIATGRGIRLSRGGANGFELGVETRAVGRDGGAQGRGAIRERAEGQELVLDRENDVEERLLAGPLGVEHSFEVRSRPEGQGPLVVDVAFDGLVPEAQGTSDRVLLRDGRGHVQGGYRDLVAVDATGRELATWMEVRGASVALVIEDATAAYPVRVDPLVWVQTADLTPSDGPNDDSFGGSVASSGNTVVVGNAGHTVDGNFEQGAAYIFVRDGATWTQQAELTASDGAAGDGFAVAVAVNGDTVIVVPAAPRPVAAHTFSYATAATGRSRPSPLRATPS